MEITRRRCEVCGAELMEGEIKCPICQHINSKQDYKICPHCNTQIPQISVYCPVCGNNVKNTITAEIDNLKPKNPDPFLAYTQPSSQAQSSNSSMEEPTGEDLRAQLKRRNLNNQQDQKEQGTFEWTKPLESTTGSTWRVRPKSAEHSGWQNPPAFTEQSSWQNPSVFTEQPSWQNPSASTEQSDWQNPSASTEQPIIQNSSASAEQSDWQNPSASIKMSQMQQEAPESPAVGQQQSFFRSVDQQQSSSIFASQDNQDLGSNFSTDAEQERWLGYLAANEKKLSEILTQNNTSTTRPNVTMKRPESFGKLKGIFGKKNKD